MQYVGILEHGKSRNHHHMHALVWLREIPEDWKKCPNRGIRDPKKRTQNECRGFRTLWPFSLPGLSPANYFRSANDVWSKLGHIAPLDGKGKALKMMSSRTAGAYIVKYLSKDHKEWHHRMKATRNLGMERLKAHLETQTTEEIEPLTWRPPQYSTYHLTTTIHSVPPGLLRREAKLIHFAKSFRCNPLDLEKLMISNSDYYMNMRQSVRDGARPDRMDSKQLYDWLSKLLPDIPEYCEDRLLAAHQQLGVLFPKIRNQVIEPIPALEIN